LTRATARASSPTYLIDSPGRTAVPPFPLSYYSSPRMIVVGPDCQAPSKFDESKLGDRPRARTKCAKCGGAIDIENPLLAAMTLPPGTMPPPPPAPPE